VVINGSRSHVDGLPASPDVKRVEITASIEKIAARLAQRGRETPEAILQRLTRNTELGQPDPSKVDLIIHNDAELAAAGMQLVAYLATQAGVSVPLARSITAA
jgi:ribose 1,5-bisphosphokinase